MYYDTNRINLLERLTTLAADNNKQFSLTSQNYEYNETIPGTKHTRQEYVIKIGELSLSLLDLSPNSLFDALVFFTAKIEYKAEVVDF